MKDKSDKSDSQNKSFSETQQSNEFVLKTFHTFFKEYFEKTYKILSESREFRMEGLLYHYTSLEALQAMIENQSLRATSIFMLNDPNELVHGYDYIMNTYFKKIAGISLDRYRCHSGTSAFVFSLSELDDNMHLWEKYGNNHRGIRIGFSPNEIVDIWRHSTKLSILLLPIVYHNGQGSYIGPYKEVFSEFLSNFQTEILSYYFKNELSYQAKNSLTWCTSLISTFIKRQEWSLEKEWRIVCLAGGQVHKNIIGDFSNGKVQAKFEMKNKKFLELFNCRGPNRPASRDVFKAGALAGNIEHIQYVIQLLMKQSLGDNFWNDNILQSDIQLR